MSNRILVSVIAAGCVTRFRNGMQFTKTPKEIKVTEDELARLQADSYLQVNVISGADDDIKQDDTGDNTGESLQDGAGDTNPANSQSNGNDGDGLAKQQAGGTNAGDEQTAGDESKGSADKGSDEPKTPKSDDLTVVVEAMQAMHIDPAGDKPTVAYLKEHGLKVSAKQRDEAWDVLVAQNAEANAH